MLSETTTATLQSYATLLLEWNQRMNLIASSTEANLWERHILDSAQVFPLLPAEARTVIDLGSGAGFPGLVLALLAQEQKRSTHFHLVESTGKKTRFLQEAAKVMKLTHVTIHNTRVEALGLPPADVVTARAFSSLANIFHLASPLVQKEHLFLLPKGCKAESEIEEARERGWEFTVISHPSRTDPQGKILAITNIRNRLQEQVSVTSKPFPETSS